MKILIINPNSTISMTEKIDHCARSIATKTTEIITVNPENSPPAIQGPEDGEKAMPHILKLFDEQTKKHKIDAAIIACFDDTGVWHLKTDSDIPVIGIGEAAFQIAMLKVQKFTTVTTLPVSVPVIEQNLTQYGYAARCQKVRACDVPVLDLENKPDASFDKLSQEIQLSKQEDNTQAIVLGCAGMADLTDRLADKHQLPVIDGVKSAVSLCETLGKI